LDVHNQDQVRIRVRIAPFPAAHADLTPKSSDNFYSILIF